MFPSAWEFISHFLLKLGIDHQCYGVRSVRRKNRLQNQLEGGLIDDLDKCAANDNQQNK
jgi:hypothetical protein